MLTPSTRSWQLTHYPSPPYDTAVCHPPPRSPPPPPPPTIAKASLVHDDVIDEAVSRRGKPSVNTLYTEKQCVLAGDYILAKVRFPRAVFFFAMPSQHLRTQQCPSTTLALPHCFDLVARIPLDLNRP